MICRHLNGLAGIDIILQLADAVNRILGFFKMWIELSGKGQVKCGKYPVKTAGTSNIVGAFSTPL